GPIGPPLGAAQRSTRTGREASAGGGPAMASYCIGDLSRREILRMSSVVAGAAMMFSSKLALAQALLRRTPGQILGPFYPLNDIWGKGADLTRPREGSGQASGQVLHVAGRALNLSGEPVRNAETQVCQTKAPCPY